MAAGIKFQRIKQRHLGSENTPVIIKRFSDHLESRGVMIITGAKAKDLLVQDGACKGALLEDGAGFTPKPRFLLRGVSGPVG